MPYSGYCDCMILKKPDKKLSECGIVCPKFSWTGLREVEICTLICERDISHCAYSFYRSFSFTECLKE